ncbi:hypothetical protein [Pelobacter propionicus]|uniref:hypothetical protein n=1 Tax=Pelobacter propionicus TaxID=29543 RepID=UPI0002E7E859|nr:hypothetical protein [Pelobacter propionicus]
MSRSAPTAVVNELNKKILLQQRENNKSAETIEQQLKQIEEIRKELIEVFHQKWPLLKILPR